jgi:hypothetical protein
VGSPQLTTFCAVLFAAVGLLSFPWGENFPVGTSPKQEPVAALLRGLRVAVKFRKAKHFAIAVSGLEACLASMGSVLAVFLLVFVLYATMGTVYFGKNDPVRARH